MCSSTRGLWLSCSSCAPYHSLLDENLMQLQPLLARVYILTLKKKTSKAPTANVLALWLNCREWVIFASWCFRLSAYCILCIYLISVCSIFMLRVFVFFPGPFQLTFVFWKTYDCRGENLVCFSAVTAETKTGLKHHGFLYQQDVWRSHPNILFFFHVFHFYSEVRSTRSSPETQPCDSPV